MFRIPCPTAAVNAQNTALSKLFRNVPIVNLCLNESTASVFSNLLAAVRCGPWTLRKVAQSLWAANPNRNHLEGVTFKAGDDCSSEKTLINELDTIDLHHASYSADPPYTVLEVIGTPISERLKAELSHYGFCEFQPTGEGFRTLRTPPNDVTRGPPHSRGLEIRDEYTPR
jgi:hypothetical protein